MACCILFTFLVLHLICCDLYLFAVLLYFHKKKSINVNQYISKNSRRYKHDQTWTNDFLTYLFIFCSSSNCVLSSIRTVNDLSYIPVPGSHRPQNFQGGDESLLHLALEKGTTQFHNKDVKRASEMEAFLVWDGARSRGPLVELGAYPVLAAASLNEDFEKLMPQPKNSRGKYETLWRCGEVFCHADSIQWILADGHGSHTWLKQLLLGQGTDLPNELLLQVPFFGELKYLNLPSVCMPLPWRTATFHNEPIFFIPGSLDDN